MIRSWANFCAPWMTRVGNSRRSCDLVEQRIDVVAARQRTGEDIRRRDRILDREIDADPADRRHGVGGIADREQPGPMPAGQPVERDGQQMQVG